MERLVAIHPVGFIKALSMALELSSTGLSQHHCRTAIIASKIGHAVGLREVEQQTLIYASLLHDVGAASDWEEKHQIIHLEAGMPVYHHAEVGYLLLKDSPQLGALATPIRHHHDRFRGGNPSGLQGTDIPLLSRIIHLADRMEILIRDDSHILEQSCIILKQLQGLSHTYFDPELLHIVEQLAKRESFWLDLTTAAFHQKFFANLNFFGKLFFEVDDLLHVAEIFATVIDRTSHYTAIHSRSTARVAVFLARRCGYSVEEQKIVKLAALLHDLGKLAVPNSILDKPGPLTAAEFSLVKQHPYFSYRILQQINGFGLIASWVGQHHEKLDGQGYPFGDEVNNIRLGSKILAVSDIFSALLEDRSYRKAMELSEVKTLMRSMVSDRKLDEFLVEALLQDAAYVNGLIEPNEMAAAHE
ncbi:MAG: HD domain-containing protein [Negativicutes bacterium]|nr:HD domain-containing protein [Negativicutes bacterium]